MKRTLFPVLFAAVLVAATIVTVSNRPRNAASEPVHAASANPVLVELFTSEGCSTCPPADALLAELATSQGVADSRVIALSEHVDYWNDLGWRDPFSSRQMSDRQSAYGRRFALDSVYTPQMVVNGEEQMVGNDRGAVTAAIRRAGRHPNALTMEIGSTEWHGDTLHFELAVTGIAPSGTAALYAALADDTDVSSVARGENGGRRLTHVQVVRSLQIIGSAAGNLQKAVDLKAPAGLRHGQMHLVVFAQQPGAGRVLGAASHPI